MIGIGIPFDAKRFRVGFYFGDDVRNLSFLKLWSNVLEYDRVI